MAFGVGWVGALGWGKTVSKLKNSESDVGNRVKSGKEPNPNENLITLMSCLEKLT
ncbi:MAG: hypothetical protein Fur0025_44160 [Oscillatoriaceae cyanobacterium]